MNLGDLIKGLEAAKPDLPVYFDTLNLIPTDLRSYRGYYDQLALGFAVDGPRVTARSLLEICRAANGAVFEGYKGGNYRMGLDTEVWVSNYGEVSDTLICDVVHKDYCVILMTEKVDD